MSKKSKNDGQSSEDQPQEEKKSKKGFESTYQAAALREAIKKGLSARSIMESLDIKSKQVLKQHILKLIQEDKVFYDIPGLYEKGGRTIRATPKSEIKIGSSVLRAQGASVRPGDEYRLTVSGDDIILSKVTDTEPPADHDLEPPLVDSFQDHDREDEPQE